MGEKIDIDVTSRFRLTIPKELKTHLKLVEGDGIWYELIDNDKAVIGRVEVKKRIIE